MRRLSLTVAALSLTVAGCATDAPRPEPQIVYKTVEVPKPVPCFTEAERPVLPPLTPIDLEHATVDQKADALAADLANERLFTEAVDRLFIRCQAAAGKAIP